MCKGLDLKNYVMQQFCGLEVNNTQVSRARQLLEEELGTWRDCPTLSWSEAEVR
jgi:hypothetical protein